eukprot:m.15201 g.15201  ORF g.15201 m.15201 type:complete len:407 (+) comp3008_c0_seq1:3-1223(+)
MSDDIIREAPAALHELARAVCHAFYDAEACAIVEILLKHKCVKEADLVEILELDSKTTTQALLRLEKDKLAHRKKCAEPGGLADATGAIPVFDYWFIHFKQMVDVIRYRLAIMRDRIEKSGLNSASHTSFECPGCHKRYGDSDIPSLLDPSDGQIRCSVESCGEVLVRDDAAIKATVQAANENLAKFNAQLGKVFQLLQDTEQYTLSATLLNPPPTVVNPIEECRQLLDRAPRRNAGQAGGQSHRTSGQRHADEPETHVQIDFSDSAAPKTVQRKLAAWHVGSTIAPEATPSGPPVVSITAPAPAAAATSDLLLPAPADSNILDLLEMQPEESAPVAAVAVSEQPMDEGDDDMMEAEDPFSIEFIVGGQTINITNIAKEHQVSVLVRSVQCADRPGALYTGAAGAI